MRRVAILLAALVALVAFVVVLALPPVFGGLARSSLDDFGYRGISVGQAFGTHAELAFAFDDWDVGWFSSTASLSFEGVRVTGQSLGSAALEPIEVVLRHGPMLSGTPSGFGWGSIEFIVDASANPMLREFYERTGVAEIARLGLLLGFGGGMTVGVDAPGFRIDEPDGDGRLDFNGLEARATIARDAIDLDGAFGGFAYDDGRSARADVGQIGLTASVYKDERIPVLWLGDVEVDGAGFRVSRDEGLTEVEDVRLRFATGVRGGFDGDVFDAALQGEAADIRVPVPNEYGGSVPVRFEDIIADVSLQYGADSVARLMDALGGNPFDWSLGNALRMLSTLDTLVRDRLAFGIERFSFTHDDRTAWAELAVEFRGDELPGYFDVSRLDRLMQSPADLPASAHVDLAFHQDLPHRLVRELGLGDQREAVELEMALREMVRTGVFEERGDDYTLRAEFDNGELRVNGESVDSLARRLGGQGSGVAELLGQLGRAF